MSNILNQAKSAVSDVLNRNNKHSVDIEQETAPAVTHERVQQQQHENVTHAIDREVHQHHHQTHVQPLQDRVVEAEQHHHNVLPAEHRHQHHGKDREVERALEGQRSQFQDTREVLPTQTSQSQNTVMGEHVHHHIHDTIQPVIEQERIQPHVVHTTKPVYEKIEKEPVIHSGNVLPTKTLAEFQSEGHGLTGHHHKKEHIDYEGDPLNIKDNSSVGFSHATRHEGLGTTGRPGELGTATGVAGAAGIVGGHHHHHHHKDTAGPHNTDTANKLDPRVDSDLDGSRTVGNTGTTGYSGTTGTSGTTGYGSTTGTAGYSGSSTTAGGAGPHASSAANKMDPRVDSDGSKGMGAGYTTGAGTTGTTGTTGTSSTLGTSGTSGSTLDTTPRTADSGYGNTAGTGLGSGTTGVSEKAGQWGTLEGETAPKESTTDKLLAKVGLK